MSLLFSWPLTYVIGVTSFDTVTLYDSDVASLELWGLNELRSDVLCSYIVVNK